MGIGPQNRYRLSKSLIRLIIDCRIGKLRMNMTEIALADKKFEGVKQDRKPLLGFYGKQWIPDERADDSPTINAGLVALWFFKGSAPVLLRNPIFLWFFRGGGCPDPLFTHLDPRMGYCMSLYGKWVCKKLNIDMFISVDLKKAKFFCVRNDRPCRLFSTKLN